MKTIHFGLLWLAALCLSCTSDITKSPAKMTDFVPGKVYIFRKPVLILNGMLMPFRKEAPLTSDGKIEAGSTIIVRKVIKSWSPEMGTWTEVYAEVLTGEKKGLVVNASGVSDRSPSGYTKRDPEVLEPVESGPP